MSYLCCFWQNFAKHSWLFLLLSLASPLRAAENSGDLFKDEIKNYDRDDIHSIQKKLFTKEGRSEANLNAGYIFNNGGYGLIAGSYTYHLLENVGFMGEGGYAFTSRDSSRIFLLDAGIIFSPLYGKLSLFTWSVVNFDVYTIAGAGLANYSGTYKGSGFMGTVGLGERFFINEYLSTRLEFRDFIYVRNGNTGQTSKLLNNYSLTAGISVLFPLREKY